MYLRENESRIKLPRLRSGMELARSVYVNTRLLFRAGTQLTDEKIATLRKWGVEDVIVQESSSSEDRRTPSG